MPGVLHVVSHNCGVTDPVVAIWHARRRGTLSWNATVRFVTVMNHSKLFDQPCIRKEFGLPIYVGHDTSKKVEAALLQDAHVFVFVEVKRPRKGTLHAAIRARARVVITRVKGDARAMVVGASFFSETESVAPGLELSCLSRLNAPCLGEPLRLSVSERVDLIKFGLLAMRLNPLSRIRFLREKIRLDATTWTVHECLDPIFGAIEATIVINGCRDRRQRCEEHLLATRPTRRVIFLHNYLTTRRPYWVRDTASDLWHANLLALEYARQKRLGSILIVEDDVEILPRLRGKEASRVQDFLRGNEDCHAYTLGSVPFLCKPSFGDTTRFVFWGGAHAVIYTPTGCRRILALREPLYGCHDFLLGFKIRCYGSSRPLAVQSHNKKTKNSQIWCCLFFRIMLDVCERIGGPVFVYEIHMLTRLVGGLWPVWTVCAILIIVLLLKVSRPQPGTTSRG